MSEPHEIGHASELVYLMGQQDAEIVEFAWDTLILDRLLNGTIAVKDVTGLMLCSILRIFCLIASSPLAISHLPIRLRCPGHPTH